MKEERAEEIKKTVDSPSLLNDLLEIKDMLYIEKVPSFGNNFFFTVGVYLLETGTILAVTGILMAVFGPYWWNTNPVGVFVGTIHLWAALAFVTLILIHGIANFFTSTFRQRKLVWMIGVAMLMLAVLEYAFGIGMRGDFVSQWNAIAGASLWNGLGLGYWINPLNEGAVYGWHVAIVPGLFIVLIIVHYGIVKKRGISVPYRKDIPYSMVSADHKKMFKRMAYILVVILAFSLLFQPPYTSPLTIQIVAQKEPTTFAITLLNEFNSSSPTATYLDTINPYTFSTRQVYVSTPYETYANLQSVNSSTTSFLLENQTVQNEYVASAFSYFENNGSLVNATASTNPLVSIIGRLVILAQNGMYQQILQSAETSSMNHTYVLRLMYDSGGMNQLATQYDLSTSQWGIIKIAPGWPLSYFLSPYNVLEIATTGIPWWSDLENGILATFAFLIVLLVLFIPYLRNAPDKLKLYRLLWNRFTIPEMNSAKKQSKNSEH